MHRKPQISLQLLGMFPHSTSQLRLLQLCHTAGERETVLLAVFQAKQCRLTSGNNPLDELIYFAFLSPTFGLNPFGLKIGIFFAETASVSPTISGTRGRPHQPLLQCCMECQSRLATRKLSICLSNAWIVTKRKKDLSRFLYYMKDHLRENLADTDPPVAKCRFSIYFRS